MAPYGIVEDEETCDKRYDEAGDVVASDVSHKALDTDHYCKTGNHGHEDSRSHGCVLAKPLCGKAKDATPHNAGA
mgnify:CR=1 FL=1